MIHCERCRTVNPPEQRYCQKCHRDLLPGEGLLVRLGVLLVSGLLTAFGVWILVQTSQGKPLPDLGCAVTNPVFWVILVIVMPISALAYAFRRTPAFQKYLNRARRHLKLDPAQALADFSQAVELAPEKERPAIFKERASLYQTLGQTQQSVRDQIASVEGEGAYQGAEGLAVLAGIDRDAFASGLKEGEIQALIKSQGVRPYGYCPKCRDAVELTEKMRCKLHNRRRIRGVRLALPEDAAQTRAEILESNRRQVKKTRVLALYRVILFALGLALLAYILKLGPFAKTPAALPVSETPTSSLAVQDASPAPSPTLTTQPAPGSMLASQFFDQNGFRFEIPGDWILVTENDQSALLEGSLKGLQESEIAYLGGAYTGFLGNCPACAQIIAAVIYEPAVNGSFSEAQFQAIKQSQQDTMGERLISYEYVNVDGVPAAESQHLGLSGEARLWEFLIVPPEPGLIYLFSMSSAIEAYAAFEPVFQAAADSLQIGAEPEPEAAPTAVQVVTRELTAIVLIDELNGRLGPGKEYPASGTLAKGQEVLVQGKNEAADWLWIYTEELGDVWVSAVLVSLRGSIDELPVIPAP